MCVLSGCDYLKSLKGIGIKRAKKVVEIAEDKSTEWILSHLSNILKMPSLHVPESYKEEFKKAVGIFRFHPVLNPVTKKVVNLSPTTESLFQEFASQWVDFQNYCITRVNIFCIYSINPTDL